MTAWMEAARKVGIPTTGIDPALHGAQFDVWHRERPEGIARLDSAVAHFHFDSLPPAARPYLFMAEVYSQAKRPDQAKRWIARYDAEVTDSLQRRGGLQSRHNALGWVAIAEGRGRDAVAEFRQALLPGNNTLCQQRALGGLGLAFDISGQLDSVRTTYERYLAVFEGLCTMGMDGTWRAPILKRLGEIYEQKGDRAKAAGYYQQFVDLWQKADPDLQPKVAEVRKRLTRLTDREKK
jgi:tetratricopeptide (TPR) repeat protein